MASSSIDVACTQYLTAHLLFFVCTIFVYWDKYMCYLLSMPTARRGETLDKIYLTSWYKRCKRYYIAGNISRLRWMQHVITSIWCQGRWTTITIYCNRVWSLRCDGCLDYSKLWKYHCINFYSDSINFICNSFPLQLYYSSSPRAPIFLRNSCKCS